MRLRAVELEDVDLMYQADNDEEARKYSDYIAPISHQQLTEYALTYDSDPVRAGQLRLVIEHPDFGAVGLADLYGISQRDSRAFVGIYILPRFRGAGYAKVALKLLAGYSHEYLGMDFLYAKVPSENLTSLSLFLNSGFNEIAILPLWQRVGRNLSDVHLLRLILE